MRVQQAEYRSILPPEVMAGVLGVVEFPVMNGCSHTSIICEILEISPDGKKIEVMATGSDRTCWWIPIETFFLRTYGTTNIRRREQVYQLMRSQDKVIRTHIDTTVDFVQLDPDRYEIVTQDTERALVGYLNYCSTTEEWLFQPRDCYMLGRRVIRQIAENLTMLQLSVGEG